MKYPYELVITTIASNKKILSIGLPDELITVSSYLYDIGNMGKWVLEGINEVLSGQSDCVERDGEFFGCQIRKDITRIEDQFEQGYTGEIETSEFKELVEIWIREKIKFNTEQARSESTTSKDGGG
jgi:hypothetical protein